MTAQERPDIAVSRPVSASQAPEVRPGGPTVQDDWRAALAEALPHEANCTGLDDSWCQATRRARASNLLPVVRRIVAAESARELRSAAHRLKTALLTDTHGLPMDVVHDLRARADELDATPDHGKA